MIESNGLSLLNFVFGGDFLLMICHMTWKMEKKRAID